MKRLPLFLPMLLLLLITASCYPNTSSTQKVSSEKKIGTDSRKTPALLTAEQKLEDFEYMYQLIEENYPFLKVNQRSYGIDWLGNKEKYRSMVAETKDDRAFYRTMNLILEDLHNGHTAMFDTKAYLYYKSLLEQLEDHEPWLDEMNKENVKARYLVNKAPSVSKQVSSEIRQSYPLVSTEIIDKNKVAYLRIPTLDYFQVSIDMEVIRPFLQEVRNYDTLIIDIRGNGGGDSSYWSDNLVPMLINEPVTWHYYLLYRGGAFAEPFLRAKLRDSYKSLKPIEEIQEYHLPHLPPETFTDFKKFEPHTETITPKNSVGFHGKIYMIVDKSVFSSSERWACFAEETKWATLVGEQTLGDGLGWESPIVALPNSGFVFRMRLMMGLKADGTVDDETKTTPSILAPGEPVWPLSDDPAVKAVLKAEAKRLNNPVH
ncbi:S41 family peptidase [Paenibacillus caui]|uniref:S41 family peptidase n=1 Tax=Paenibacillus caui TaxID=2873927 RepID=UPI001CAA3231|nr:S41 family peptidase [Paenibacillus caui]